MFQKLLGSSSNSIFPKVHKNEVYETHTFSLNIGSAIKTIEESTAVKVGYQTLRLLDDNGLVDKLKHRYRFVHIGLVQVALTPLFRRGINSPILVALRDCRRPDYDDSLLGLVKSNLCNGSVYFNCFPGFSVSLTAPNLLDALTLNIDTSGIGMKEGTSPVAVNYRIICKVMTDDSPNAKENHRNGFTTVFEMPSYSSNGVAQRKVIFWKDPHEWIQEVADLYPVEYLGCTIIKNPDGSVNFSFYPWTQD